MNGLKNLAGNDVLIFLFRFEILVNGINFVLNEGIAEDMYPDLDKKLKPLVHACCETLLRYKHLSASNTIMDGNVLNEGSFEVMLSKGLGIHFIADEKQRLFSDAKKIYKILETVMNRRTKELKEGKPVSPSHRQNTVNPAKLKKGLEQLGKAQNLSSELQYLAEGKRIRPGLKQLQPNVLPTGVTASRGYDHRGHCITFEHNTLGELGKIVLIKSGEVQTLVQAELCIGQGTLQDSLVKKKKKVFEKVIACVHNDFNF